MNLNALLKRRLDSTGPVRAGLIGAGKFAAMFLSQLPRMPGIDLVALADLDPGRAHRQLVTVGWPPGRIARTAIFDDGLEVAARDDLDVVIEATGDPLAGLAHAEAGIAAGNHMVMVNVEADVLAGPLLAAKARENGLVYSLAYGDQPALVCELVDWARACGFEVVAAGKGTKYLPRYHLSTPDTVWDHYGLTAAQATAAGMNAKMFNSFLDGTKSAIEMAAIANATGLLPPDDGLLFPPCGAGDLAKLMIPKKHGGVLARSGTVEVVSSLTREGMEIADDLRWGVYVTFAAPNDYTAQCFSQYGVRTDPTGRYASLYRPSHLIGLELNISVLNAALRGEPTGVPTRWTGDVAAIAKRDLKRGEVLDGEGGSCVWGKLIPAAKSLKSRALPIGLAHGVALKRPVAQGAMLTREDVALDESLPALAARREMARRFAP